MITNTFADSNSWMRKSTDKYNTYSVKGYPEAGVIYQMAIDIFNNLTK